MCDENCSCILCLELRDCESQVNKATMGPLENFILRPSDDSGGQKNYTFFGMQDVKSLQRFGKADENNNNDVVAKNRHKSVIYVSDDGNAEVSSEVSRSEIIDEFMSLTTVENSRVVSVVFKGTFSFATQLVNEVMFSCQVYYDSDGDEDDFPLGMEADYLNRTSCYYLKKKW